MSKDTIYREDVINTLADMHCKSDEDGYVWIIRSDAWARIDALPSVQLERNTGWWINDNCSECGQYVFHGDARNFCPNCGVDMRGEQDEESD